MPSAEARQLVREPVYQQMNAILRELLHSGEFAAGDKFLTEREIAERFQVSRPTANKVLAGMVSEGLLEFRKGVGTFVCLPRLDYDVQTLVSFTEKAREAGRTPATRIIEFRRLRASEADASIAARLCVDLRCELYVMARLRLAGGIPVILERRWLPAALFPGLTRPLLRGSFYALCRGLYGHRIAESDQTIRAVKLSGNEARLLQTRGGSPALLVSAVGYSGANPIWWERTLYRGDAYEFHRARSSPGRLIPFVSR